MKRLLTAWSLVLASASIACADWTPMLTAADFDGLRADVLTLSGGVISVLLIVSGLGYLIHAMSR
jgi:hypothetical protein